MCLAACEQDRRTNCCLFTDLVFKAPWSLFEKLRDFHSKGAISEI